MFVALLGIASLGAMAVYPPLYPAGLALVGRRAVCSVSEALAGIQKRYLLNDEAARVSAAMRLVRRENGLSLWETPDGPYWIPSGSDDVLPVLLAQQDLDIYGTGEGSGIAPGDVVFDCGAHVGVYVRKALQGGASKVVAVEPAPDNIECLRRNFAGEIAQGRVILRAEGVWDRQDQLPLFKKDSNSAADSFVIQGGKQASADLLPLTTIDLIVEELKLDKVDVIKMDIKGATGKALVGAKTTLERWQPRLALSTEEAADNPVALSELVARLGHRRPLRCGHCSVHDGHRVLPDVLLFD